MSLKNLDVSASYRFPGVLTPELFADAIKWDINYLLPIFIDNMYKLGYENNNWEYEDWLECFLAWSDWVLEDE